jgi:hypothetical protein
VPTPLSQGLRELRNGASDLRLETVGFSDNSAESSDNSGEPLQVVVARRSAAQTQNDCAHELLPPEVGQVDLDFHRGGLVVVRPVLGFEHVGVAALAEFFCFGGEEA